LANLRCNDIDGLAAPAANARRPAARGVPTGAAAR
jgi:hypothetical protein